MIALWILYVGIISSLLAAAAYALEHFAAARGWPRRWVWLAAMLAVPMMPLLTRTLPIQLVEMPTPPVVRPAQATGSATELTHSSQSTGIAGGWMHRLTTVVEAVGQHARASVGAAVSVSPWLGAFWLLTTCMLIIGYVATAIRLSAQRRRWPQVHIDGSDVLVAPEVGPAVIGTIRPAIVLPAWALTIEAPARQLIVAHEQEHLRAGDPFTFHAATFFTYLLPWNVPMWWMLRRLRLAIEMDCDQRVLRGGCDAIRYADLLLTVGRRRSTGRRVLAPALVEHHSLLGRRILAMCPAPSKYRMLRVLLAGTAAGTLIVAAYTIPRPALAQTTPLRVPVSQQNRFEVTVHPLNTEAVVLEELVARSERSSSPRPAAIPPAPSVPPLLEDVATVSWGGELSGMVTGNIALAGIVRLELDLPVLNRNLLQLVLLMQQDERSGRAHKNAVTVISAREVPAPAQHPKVVRVRSGNVIDMFFLPFGIDPLDQPTDSVVRSLHSRLGLVPTTRKAVSVSQLLEP